MCNSYLLGNVVRLSVAFTNVDGVAANPTTVTLEIKKPDLTVETFTPTNDSTGNYHYDYEPTQIGAYYYVFNGTGEVIASTQGQFKTIPQSV